MEYQRASAATAFSKKLSNGHRFNGKNMYDGVFGGQTKVGSRVEDYAEIFGGSSGSSIPILDAPELSERKFSVDVSSSKLDYANIFGGFGDLGFGVSHEECIAKPTRDTKTPAKTRSYSEGSFSYPVGNQVLSNELTSLELGNAVKQFKMSYNKSIPVRKNGTNGTTHVAKLHAVPGYSCLIDEQVTPSRDKPVSPDVNERNATNNAGEGLVEGIHKKSASNIPSGGVSKETFERVDGLSSMSRSYVSDYSDVLFGSYNVGHKTPPTKVPRAASMLNNIDSNKRDSLKFGVSRSYSLDGEAGVSSPPYFDDEVDANSVAATSAAAVKKAIEEAQARLRIAKELMERRKEGYATHIKPNFNGGLKGEKRKKVKDTIKENNVRQDKAQETCEKIDAYVQTSAGVRKQNVTKVGQVVPESEVGKKFFTTREAAGGTYGKNFILSEGDCRQEDAGKKEVAKEGEREKEVMQAPIEYEGQGKKIIEKQEKDGEKLEVVVEAPEEKVERKLDASDELYGKIECLNELKSDAEFYGQKEDETMLSFAEQCEEAQERMSSELDACDRTLKEQEKPTENGRKVDNVETHDIDNMENQKVAQEIDNVETHDDNMETQKVARDIDNVETHNHILKQEEDGSGLEDFSGKEDNEMLLQDVSLQKEFEKRSEETFEMPELMGERKETCGAEENNEEEEGASNREDNEQMLDEMEKPEIIDLTHNDFDKEEERQRRLEEKGDLLGDEEFMEAKENGAMFEDAYQMEPAEEEQKEAPESVGTEEMQKQTDHRADEMTQAREDVLGCYQEDLEAVNDSDEENHINNFVETKEPSKREANCQMTPELLVNEEIDRMVEESKDDIECKETRRNSDAVEVPNDSEENLACDKAGFAESNSKFNEIEQELENTTEPFDFDRNSTDTDAADRSFEDKQYEQTSEESGTICNTEKHVQELVYESKEDIGEAEVVKQEDRKYKFEFHDERRWVDSQLDCNFGEKHETTEIAHESESSPSTENDEENHQDTLTKEVRESENNSQEVELVEKQQRTVDEAKERERERDKERIAVERAIREARERAFAEARERAAAERKNVEARRKEKDEAQGESAKPSADDVDKTYMEAKLKAERAAVERATAEARQRALEKALSEKAAFGTRNQAEKVSDAKQSFQYSYDSRNKGSSPATGRYPNSSNQSASHTSEGLNGATGESAQRCKARLERHHRMAERAAKALAEKNKRDLLAQKEQAERNRLAETLDAEVKRWSSGKQGNLRALLSTLQYILGPDSGWQPIPLTEMIVTAAVKKAYRKATLCVHPDKLQQRGASIQQKYICEKVFDLLKEAWNKFSAEER